MTLTERKGNLTQQLENAKAQVYAIQGALALLEELLKEDPQNPLALMLKEMS